MDEHHHSAIDLALENNLNLSVNLMIEYVTVHQNSFVFSNLFLHNLVHLMNQGITLTPLFESKIFHMPFEYDQWPAVHQRFDKMYAPYNSSILKMRFKYPEVFRDLWMEYDYEQPNFDTTQEFRLNESKKRKISYRVISLFNVIETFESGTLIEALMNCNELSVFYTETIQDYIEYKWIRYAKKAYFKGFLMHSGYIISFLAYLSTVILEGDSTLALEKRKYPSDG